MSGEQGEDIPSHDKVKTDPNEPADKKRAHVEGQVHKRLGPEDHQYSLVDYGTYSYIWLITTSVPGRESMSRRFRQCTGVT